MAATYDYIVVGAGSAGCVVAARLAEDGSTRVLLLEAGGSDRRSKIRMPAAFSRLYKTDVDWNYQTEEEPALAGRKLYWPRGKVLGGCSSINAMIYVRGHRSDYDSWAAQGNDGWSFAEVLPYFRRSENQERGGDAFHGTGGPLNVADLRCRNPLSEVFVEACAQVGIRRNDDFNGAEQDGAGFYQVNQRRGRRCSAADAYLRPSRRDLTTLTDVHVTRVLFEGNRAVGVEYLRRGLPEQARAGREVILCGGAVNSPQMLLLSGVGPAADLKRLGLPLVVDLPGVGRNLQDHPAVCVSHACTRPITLDRADTFTNLVRYFFRRGPLTSNIAEAGAFVRTSPAKAAPDLQLYFGPVYFLEHGFHRPPGHGFTLGACLLRPASRGTISLRSRDPLQPPLLRPGYLEAPDDCRTLVEGMRRLRRIAAAPALDPWRGSEYLPGETVRTDEEIEGDVRRRVQTLYHPVGTCRMGTDSLSVVTPRLEVHGTTGLRVVDASVMPTLVGGNTHAPTVMIAEKAADLILGRSPPQRADV
jgi:choline dehydrogenase